MTYTEIEMRINVAGGSGGMCIALNKLLAKRHGMLVIRHFKLENNIAYLTLAYNPLAFGIRTDLGIFINDWAMK